MTYADTVKAVSEEKGYPRPDVDRVLDGLRTVIQRSLAKGGEVYLPGLGRFEVTERAARMGRNPKTGAEIDIPAKRAPKFTAAKALKDAASG